jgi:hypothetical protein
MTLQSNKEEEKHCMEGINNKREDARMGNKIIVYVRDGMVTDVYSTAQAEVEIFDRSELSSAPDDEIKDLEKEWERGEKEAKKMKHVFGI